MASGRDEVQQRMNTVIPEAGVALDTALLRQNIVVLTLEVPDDLLEPVLPNNARREEVSETRTARGGGEVRCKKHD